MLSVNGKVLSSLPSSTRLDRISEIEEGSLVTLQSKGGSFESKAFATLKQSEAKETEVKGQQSKGQPAKAEQPKEAVDEKPKKGKCLHGPNGRCLNCPDEQKDSDKGEKYLKTDARTACNHGPNGRCLNCAIKDTSEAKHIAFDDFIDKKYPQKGMGKNQKSLGSMVDLAVDFKIKPNCKNHEPYPKGMCSQCMPPSINVKRQEYRHVDYIEFMNFGEISRFIKNWMETGYQRVGILYGYFAEDPIYHMGVRAIVEMVYEPPQDNKYNDTVLLPDPFAHQVERIVSGLGFERLGMVFTTFDKSSFLSSEEMIRAALLQEKHSVDHPVGIRVTKQITVVLRGGITS